MRSTHRRSRRLRSKNLACQAGSSLSYTNPLFIYKFFAGSLSTATWAYKSVIPEKYSDCKYGMTCKLFQIIPTKKRDVGFFFHNRKSETSTGVFQFWGAAGYWVPKYKDGYSALSQTSLYQSPSPPSFNNSRHQQIVQ